MITCLNLKFSNIAFRICNPINYKLLIIQTMNSDRLNNQSLKYLA